MTKTTENLQAAFAGESQANRKYLAFAEKAEAEGKPGVAKLFRCRCPRLKRFTPTPICGCSKASAPQKRISRPPSPARPTSSEKMYPEMMEDAKEEGENAVLRYFGFANEAEKVHAELYTAALEADSDTFADAEFYICSVCGHTQDGEATEKCPICGAAPKAYRKVD